YQHQVPGGMLSNLRHQLRKVGLEHKYPEALEETIRVRAEFGFPIMVTPLSQFVGSQAAINVSLASAIKKSRIKSSNSLWVTPAPRERAIWIRMLRTRSLIAREPRNGPNGSQTSPALTICDGGSMRSEPPTRNYCCVGSLAKRTSMPCARIRGRSSTSTRNNRWSICCSS